MFLRDLHQSSEEVAVAYVPTEFIATREDDDWDLGIQIIGELSGTMTTS